MNRFPWLLFHPNIPKPCCHNYIHDGRMLMMVKQGEFDPKKYEDIIEHGETVLKQWFELKGWNWKGYKKAYQPFCPSA